MSPKLMESADYKAVRIIVYQHPDETSRTPNKACYWIASANIDGQQFIGRSRHGAVNELARQLVAAGVPDAPMKIYTAGLKGFRTIPSFHRAAESTYEESGSVLLRRIPYARVAAARERARSIGVEGPKQWVSGPGGNPVAADLSVPEKLDHPIRVPDEPTRRAPDLDRAKRLPASRSADGRQGDLFPDLVERGSRAA